MNKKDLVARVATKTGNTKVLTKDIVDATFDSIVDSLSEGNRIHISGFGGFKVVKRDPRQGRNPGDGSPVDVPKKNIVKFRTAVYLRDKVND